jgi:hypothetical protein
VSCTRLARFFQLPILKNHKESSTKENVNINISNASFSWDVIIHDDKDTIERTFIEAMLAKSTVNNDIDLNGQNDVNYRDSNEDNDEHKINNDTNTNDDNNNRTNNDSYNNDNKIDKESTDDKDPNNDKYTLKNINFTTNSPTELIAIIGVRVT